MKKYIGIAAVAVLLAAAVWWSISLNSAKAPEDGTQQAQSPSPQVQTDAADPAQEDFYAAFREQREETRGLELGYLDEIIATGASDSETVADALEQKLTLVANMEIEFVIESRIRAKGFTDAAVTFSQGRASVSVDCDEVTGEQAAQILEIVCTETGISADKVRITPNPK